MDFETKLYIIIVIVIFITLRTFIDLFYSTNFKQYDNKEDQAKADKAYDQYMYVKSFLDVPLVLLSIFLLFNINFNVKLYSFIFFSFFYIFIDHYLEYLDIPFDENSAYFIERYFPLLADLILLISGLYIIFKIFYVK